ncbi:MAG TPA: alpha/beta hydrolase [Enhygromyxa sp.]|nr:alpha/beta hydrolase [Enhygromyxa sp.]
MNAELPGPDREGQARLLDGRTLGYAVFGRGEPVVIWLHGTPGGRRQVPPAAREFAVEHDIRVIGIERPGIGDSTPHLYPNVLGFARDLDTVLDQLDVDRCGVVGLSGGGPYALACAHALARVRVCGVLGGVAPTRGPEAIDGGATTLARFAPLVERLHGPIGAALSLAIRSAHPLASPAFDLFMKLSREGDREVFSAPGMKEMFLDDMLRASRSGVRSMVFDYLLFSRDWGFSLRDIDTPTYLWHGDADPFVPLDHGQHQARLLRNSTLTVQPGHSHLGGLAAAEAVLTSMLARL